MRPLAPILATADLAFPDHPFDHLYLPSDTTTHLDTMQRSSATNVLFSISWTVTLVVLWLSVRALVRKKRRETLESLLLSQSCTMWIVLSMRALWTRGQENVILSLGECRLVGR